MQVIDLHCDVLYKIQNGAEKGEQLLFANSPKLDVNLERMRAGGVKVQAFAIFVAPDQPIELQYTKVLDQIKIFQEEVVAANPGIVHITEWQQINDLKEDEIGAFLTLEGLDCIGNTLDKLIHVLDQGILSVGLTWNYGNFVADGVGEIRGAGLSNFGFDVINLLNTRGILVDVSHLSVAGFYDVMQVAKYPIASHSNVYQVADNRRNLNNAQIMRMVERKAPIHLVFAPAFVNANTRDGRVVIADLLEHIAYLIDLGALDQIGLGSDFDGIASHVVELSNASEFPNLLSAITANYGVETAKNIASQNFLRYVLAI